MRSGSTHLACNEERLCRLVALRRKHRPAYRATGATDTVLPERRFYGYHVPHLYNESRPHASLGDRTPSEFASESAASRALTAT
jgi:hypothetical protein